MTQAELLTTITSIKLDTLEKYSIYFNCLRIDDKSSIKSQKEHLKALDIYIQILDYYYVVEALDNEDATSITSEEIYNVIEAAISLLRTFKSSYYD